MTPPETGRAPRRGPVHSSERTTQEPRPSYATGVTGESDQPSLLDLITSDASTDRPLTIEQQFLAFVEANSWFEDEFVRRCRLARSRGYTKIGIRRIIEPMRWDHEMEHRFAEDGVSEFAVNNNVLSRISRWIEERYPEEFGDFFTKRELRAQ